MPDTLSLEYSGPFARVTMKQRMAEHFAIYHEGIAVNAGGARDVRIFPDESITTDF